MTDCAYFFQYLSSFTTTKAAWVLLVLEQKLDEKDTELKLMAKES